MKLGSFQAGCEFSCVLTHGQQIHRSDPDQESSAVQTFLLKHYFSTLTSMLRKPFPGPQAPDLQWRSERLKTIGSIARFFFGSANGRSFRALLFVAQDRIWNHPTMFMMSCSKSTQTSSITWSLWNFEARTLARRLTTLARGSWLASISEDY